MLDISVSYNRYKFLGHEFLTWLWFLMETDPDQIVNKDNEPVLLGLGSRIVLENSRSEGVETITIKGGESELEEGRLAVRKGALVTEMNLNMEAGGLAWIFDLKGESLDVAGLKLPETDGTEQDSVEAAVLDRIDLYETVVSFVQHTYTRFIKLRVSRQWQEKTAPGMKKWITSS
ncbi:MAG: hypothetical protein SWH61_13510 [Thermodesulfobacteriota bacterium]|nr:hypothetical protein [Thermodesulfobacteriota bacterium]